MSKRCRPLSCALAALSLMIVAAPATAKNWKYIQLRRLTGSDPRPPLDGPILDKTGDLYFTTYQGGAYNYGAVVQYAPSEIPTVLHSFGGYDDGADPVAGLTWGPRGDLYGTTLWTVFRLAPDGKEKVLYEFTGGKVAPTIVAGVLKIGRDLYGTTLYGGIENCPLYANECGFVFRVGTDGTETTVHEFTGGDDGAQPHGALVADAVGNLYGTTQYGGGSKGCGDATYGCGTVFKIAPDGTESIFHRFTGYPSDGGTPVGTLLLGDAGNLYGTTQIGGSNCADAGCGTVFRLSPDGTETILYSFAGGGGGASPYGSLVQDAQGNLLGTTQGAVFELTPGGSLNLLHQVSYPQRVSPGLAMDKSGNLFGATWNVSSHTICTIFELKRQ